MKKFKPFLSLKWKLSLGLGFILITLYSAYSFYIYQQATENFLQNRVATQQKQINIARALTAESVFVLERFNESILVAPQNTRSSDKAITKLFNKYWTHWQVIWNLEGATLHIKKHAKLKHWGKGTNISGEALQQVFKNEAPYNEIQCRNGCVQQIITPILSNSKVIGALSLSVSLVDTLLQYQNTTNSDLGVLIHENDQHLSAITQAQENTPIWQQFIATHPLSSFTNKALPFTSNQHRYEIIAFSINHNQKAPYFISINDISEEYTSLQNKLFQQGSTGLIGLLAVILMIFIIIQLSIKKILQLSNALPLLAKHQYGEFKEQLATTSNSYISDEISTLTKTAIGVSQQLQSLSLKSQKSTQLLIQNSTELAKQRNFMEQLIETAPIIIITQSIQGEILSINKEALQEFGVPSEKIIGRPFSDFIPKNETKHLLQLKQLGKKQGQPEINYSGHLSLNNSEDTIYISWIHSLIHATDSQQDSVILSLGMDVTERHIADEQLVWIATHDQLTGLSNRRNFLQKFNAMLAVAERYDDSLALFYLDLDQFKVINDTHGHQAGDELLQSITRELKYEVRETDLLSRIGGDEFTLVTPSATVEGAIQLANKLLAALKNIHYTINDQPYPVSFSIGIAIYPQHGKDQQALLANADLAMYHAKKSGRSRYHIFSPDFEYQAVLTEQLHWKNIILNAIKDDSFVLFYQPILDIKYKIISHYECLLRIDAPDGKLLMPGDFIIQAEEIGIIDQIDRLVLKKAIERHLSFQKMNNNARLAINLSGRSMNDETILPYIEELLRQPGVKPELIIFEITETSAVSNFLSAKSMIQKLKALGCSFALDDFGVGFSSFYYLKSLPVDYVKIDGSFVKQMDTNDEDRIFVKVLTEVSQAFGKKIIAEFVENEMILQLLEQQGVDYAQGYYVSKPIRDPLDLSHVKGLK